MKSYSKIVLTAGFAMFSMFFGSGNLVFPLVIGTATQSQSPWAMLGLFCTGVFVPFLGLIGVILFAGSRANYFAAIGKWPAFFLTFAMLALMGPIGVIPRCILVAHGGISLMLPELSLPIFSAAFCLLTLLCVWNHDRVIPIIGKYLTPFLLLGIAIITITGLFFSDFSMPSSSLSNPDAFLTGLFDGYQTMDLLAAFFFSATTVAYLRSHLRSDDRPNTLLKLSLYSSFIGAGFIALIYLSFVGLGAKFAPQLLQVEPQQMLAHISHLTLGPLAMPIVSVTIALACLTTATILVMLFSDFLHEDISKERIGLHPSILITLAISYLVSLIGFDSLKIWIFTILQVAYPALIVFTLCNILSKLWNIHFSRSGFYIALLLSIAYYTFV